MSTRITIEGEKFLINGEPTYKSRSFEGKPVEGLLFNTRMVQAIFDDENAESAKQWAYPDTRRWDPDRNLGEFIAQLPTYHTKGIRAVTLNLQGGMPVTGTERAQPWINSAFTPQGELKPKYLERLEKALRACDDQGIAVILGYYYFGQDENMADEAAIIRGVDNITDWLLDTGLENVMVEVNNECDVPLYEHEILTPARVHELITRIKTRHRDGRRLLVAASVTNWPFKEKAGLPLTRGNDAANVDQAFLDRLARGKVDKVIEESDFILFHGNGLDPAGIDKVIRVVKDTETYKTNPRPLCINEDSTTVENMDAAFPHYVPWGYYDQGKNNYRDGFQSPPVNWGISTPEKRRFFDRVAEITGAAG
ncbi:hypothetical protein [Devosia nitrariae]|uniref:Uncharacterized protein n=1 Tax=Devosia nitrariae TaxID=2071872 RepID=A0ABQ5W6I2_9HYPH|nr:hypothetical protein [Devosia nitrariae]GLQ55409.1 hypothetical protein GCM10010862_26680 [Devosia nitrariae]